jgi:hypothetical protein
VRLKKERDLENEGEEKRRITLEVEDGRSAHVLE